LRKALLFFIFTEKGAIIVTLKPLGSFIAACKSMLSRSPPFLLMLQEFQEKQKEYQYPYYFTF